MRKMIWFKACPRCKVGDLTLTEDVYGKYKQCFQCGHLVYPRTESTLPLPEQKKTRKQEMAA
jgi:hypothetical protein